jgi:hypothetical protein
VLVWTVPQFPLPITVVNESRVGVGVPQAHPPAQSVVVVVLVLLAVVVVVVVVAGHRPEPVGSQSRLIFTSDVPPFALILHFPSFLPFFFVRTVTFACDPQTASVPLGFVHLPTGPQCPDARTFFGRRLGRSARRAGGSRRPTAGRRTCCRPPPGEGVAVRDRRPIESWKSVTHWLAGRARRERDQRRGSATTFDGGETLHAALTVILPV